MYIGIRQNAKNGSGIKPLPFFCLTFISVKSVMEKP